MSVGLEKYQLTRPALSIIASEAQNERYIAALLELERQDHLTSEDRKYARLLAALIEKYEKEKYPIGSASPIEVLHELIAANGLRQKDLVFAFGTESVVSEVLSGKRELNKDHIVKLCERFNLSPAVFF